MNKQRALVLIVAYRAEATVSNIVKRIPFSLSLSVDVDVLIINDFSIAKSTQDPETELPFGVRILHNPVPQGHGGNQKIGFLYAIQNRYDIVAVLSSNGQDSPESLPDLIESFRRKKAAAIFGSRMLLKGSARKGGMPLNRYLGNKTLTWIQNLLLKSSLSEFHSTYRVFSVDALKKIPFERNSNDFEFDTEIIIQFMIAGLCIEEVPVPTNYSDERFRPGGLRYPINILMASLRARLQRMSLFYDKRYDCSPTPLSQYSPKLEYSSPHSFVIETIPDNARVLDLGSAGGYIATALRRQKLCHVTAVDAFPTDEIDLDEFYLCNLNQGLAGIPVENRDFVLLLDVIEHLASPEAFLDELRERMSANPNAELIISTGNIAFIVTRLMLLCGQFNYGKRGILDLTHTRLFTFSSLRRALEQTGFIITASKAIPAPVPLAIGYNVFSRSLLAVNSLLNKISPSLFAYQMVMRAKPLPTVNSLLNAARIELVSTIPSDKRPAVIQ
jgi:2-polyprenyl-3-methyl-5-hydroxy-6-metoxy-1,4-benzoquinol methylase